MELFTILATCAALSGAAQGGDPPVSPADCEAAVLQYQANLQAVELSAADRDAIARVAYAEAANQGDSGLAGVVYTVVNRLISGQWGESVTAVVNAPNQFEPVHKAGGWQQLPSLSPSQKARVDTIINLALDGRLPDLTNGALFFQNPEIVANREAAGTVSEGLTHFGGSPPSAVIQDHAFYAAINNAGSSPAGGTPVKVQAERRPEAKPWDIYGQAQDQELQQAQSWDVFATGGGAESVLVGGREGQ